MAMQDKDNNRNEHGHRVVDPKMVEAPTFQFVCGVALCPGCGACCADYQMAKDAKVEKPKLDINMSDPAEGKKQLQKYFGDVRHNPDNGIYCSAPMQINMPEGKALPAYKNPDVLCNCFTLCCCWRGAAVAYFMMMAAPAVMAAKWGLGMLAAGTISCCLCIALFARCCAIFVPRCFNMKTPSMKETFLNVIDMKRADAMEADLAGRNGGMQGKFQWQCNQGAKYCEAIVGGICCCRFCMPSTIFTFAKILFAMMFTEIGMVVSAYMYAVGRFMCGSGCWTLGSFAGWVREFLVSMALRKRILQWKYPAWGYTNDKSKEDQETPESCCDGCIKACCACPICKMCQCELCCDIACPLFCELCDMSLEMFGEFSSAILLTGKALFYTDRLFLAGKRKSQTNADTGNVPERTEKNEA